ncbi:uncharacterized protein EV422DRAFT_566042 [Fimicolochytrium jonesii]|uniref:uncharacterized protein n=1 Tax=Fimicolochytrium jonesii TaxID=1396493 RepID=UPI0022FDF03C|nr:uncharacterized protein EV422DRAFT_566042 [Fimicolochytrium jonesii]KAI8823184.1 hypothetical protein EV422DRAFT_566042 [Fimicolochytrium jonesii]
MRLRHIERTATLAWSPGQRDASATGGPLLAAGTVAGALDASFSTAAELELFDLNLNSKHGAPGSNKLRRVGNITTSARFNRLAWGSIPGDAARPLGVLASGMENGELNLWNPAAIAEGNAQKALLMRHSIHKGPVRGLDFNNVQGNLLASGATDGEVFIWDLTNPQTPYTPGTRSQRLEDITTLAWNQQVAYILGTGSNNGNTVLWDLRTKRELFTLGHPGGRKPITAVAWNPSVATQLITASDDDSVPTVLVWDLRNAAAPQMGMHGHTKGILSLAWCPKDSDLLLSCGKDNTTLAWNPNTGELIGELARTNNWSFDVQWCPKNPDLVAVSSFDGAVSVHSLQSSGSEEPELPPSPVHQVHSDDPFAPQNLNPPQAYVPSTFALRQPPKWLRRPVGATFGFGGKLVSFDPQSRGVSFRTVATESAFAHRVAELEAVLADDQMESYKIFCERRALANDEGDAVNEADREMWKFMKVMLESGARDQVVEYLGLNRSNIGGPRLSGLLQKLKASATTKEEARGGAADAGRKQSIAGQGPAGAVPTNDPAQLNGLNKLFGASQVEFPDIPQPDTAAPEHPAPPPARERRHDPFSLYPTKPGPESDVEILLTKALILGDFETAVDIALGANRLADAMLLAVSGGPDLLLRTQQEYFRRQKDKTYVRVLQSVVDGDLQDVVENGHLDGREGGWKDILALICTYAKPEDAAQLFSALGRRLEQSPNTPDAIKQGPKENKKFAAVLCYIAAGDLHKVVDVWSSREVEEEHKLLQGAGARERKEVTAYTSHVVALQSLIEKVTVFRKAIGFIDPDLANQNQAPTGIFDLESLYDRYAEYAESVAGQGKLDLAWSILELIPASFRWSPRDTKHSGSEDAIAVLRDRVYRSGGVRRQVAQVPGFPFLLQEVGGAAAQQQQQQQHGQAYQQHHHQYQTAYPQQQGGYQGYYNQPATAAAPVQSQWGASAGQQQPQINTYTPATASGGYTQQPQSTYAHQPTQSQFGGGGGYTQQAVSQYDQYGNPVNQQTGYYQQNSQSNSQSNLYGNVGAPPPPPMGGDGLGPSFQSTQNVAPTTHFNDPPFVPLTGRLGVKPASVIAPPPAAGSTPSSWQQQPAGYQQQQQQQQQPPPSGMLSPPPTLAGSQQATNYLSPFVNGGQGVGQGQQHPPVQRSTSVASVRRGSGTPQPKFPPGDRSHIPAAHKPLYDGLQKYMGILKGASTAPQQKRVYDDSEKKINILYDQLNAEEVPADVVGKMIELVKALDAHAYPTATNIQVDLMTTRYEVTSKWLLVVKRLIDAAERAHLGPAAVNSPNPGGPVQPAGFGGPQQGYGPPPTQQQQQGLPPPPLGVGPPPPGAAQLPPPPMNRPGTAPPPPTQQQQQQQQQYAQPPPPQHHQQQQYQPGPPQQQHQQQQQYMQPPPPPQQQHHQQQQYRPTMQPPPPSNQQLPFAGLQPPPQQQRAAQQPAIRFGM